MTNDLKKFLDSLTPEDYKGKETAPKIKAKAKRFLNSGKYESFEQYKGFDIHNSLCCLIYDNI